MTRLTSLNIHFGVCDPVPDTTIFNLLKFDIGVGGLQRDIKYKREFLTRLSELRHCNSVAFRNLIERAEELIFCDTDVKLSCICGCNREAFADLRYLYIEIYQNMDYLARMSQEEIQHSLQLRTSFSRLTILEIRRCYRIKYLFCNTVVKSLVLLQELLIYKCPEIEVIIMNDGTSDGDIINFSKLKSLKILNIVKPNGT